MNKVHFAVTSKYHQVPTVRTTLVGKIFFQKPNCTEGVPKNAPVFPLEKRNSIVPKTFQKKNKHQIQDSDFMF